MPEQGPAIDREWVEACLANDCRAQQRLFNAYYSKMLSVCLRYTANEEEARDVLQDGFIKVFSKLNQYTFNGPLEGWIRRVIINCAIDYTRTIKNRPRLTELSANVQPQSSDNVESDMRYRELLLALRSMPEGYRHVFNMYVIEGYNHREIAEQLGISEGTSKSQLAKARVFLQRKLKKSETNG